MNSVGTSSSAEGAPANIGVVRAARGPVWKAILGFAVPKPGVNQAGELFVGATGPGSSFHVAATGTWG